MIKIKYSCLFFLIFKISFLVAQGTDKKYDFENQGNNWSTSNEKYWSFSNEKAAAGTYSLKYTIPENAVYKNTAIVSINTEHTIMKVRTANKSADEQIIIGSDYDGILLGVSYDGVVLWKSNTGKGTMNHDIWCDDITGDGIDEILVANANGYLYCFDIDGKELWNYKPYEGDHLTPMYAVCVVKDTTKTPYIVCGDYTSNIYYLSSSGSLLKTVASTKYSKVKGFGDNRPTDFKSISNFLRPIPLADGSDLLLVHTNNNHMQTDGEFHIMKPLSETSQLTILDPQVSRPVGEVRITDMDKDGHYDLLYGTSGLNTNIFCRVVFNEDYTTSEIFKYVIEFRNLGARAYRVNQPFILPSSSGYDYGLLSGNQLLTYPKNGDDVVQEQLSSIYAYNDIWSDKNDKTLMASSQDGGSCIHIIDTKNDDWKEEYKSLEPIGKIAKIKNSTRKIREDLSSYIKPSWQRDPVKVIGFEGRSLPIASKLTGSESLELLASPWNRGKNQEKSWRTPLYNGNTFKDKEDRRNTYTLTEQEVFDFFTPSYTDAPGISTWAGHGNDPLYYSLDVLKRIADFGFNNGGKRTIYVYPEMNQHSADFNFVMQNQIYPLIAHLKTLDSKVAFRAKNVFWQVYTDTWAGVVSGEYANEIIPVLEETTDKTQDLSITGRLGLWASGAINGWGVRCSRDDVSFDRSRQFSSQKLANHFLRKIIYSVACGANYLHNNYTDAENPVLEYHTSLALELIEKEALYVPKRNEILSFSPVHLSITSPQESYLNEAENNKWVTYFDKEREENNPAVFSHMNGTWLGATLTPWDFSTYASGVVDRRQNAIPFYPNGKVLITPVQNGALADNSAPRGKMVDNLHPIYKDIMKEYITDGVDYISANGTQKFKADTHYTQIKNDIEEGASKLPITVSGDKVGWVVAQMSPTRLRLTIVDGGFLSPDDRKVTVKFNTVTPVKVQDILDKKVFDLNGSSTEVDIPCGMFRFIDVELSSPLN